MFLANAGSQIFAFEVCSFHYFGLQKSNFSEFMGTAYQTEIVD